MKKKRLIPLILTILIILCFPVSTFALEVPAQSIKPEGTIITPFLLLQEETQRERTFDKNEEHPASIFVQNFIGYDSHGNPIILMGTLYESGILWDYPVAGKKTVIYQGTISTWV
ncbi:hypothetical protein [Acetanaerobacterium elongatum]|uniref:Uncharacterized protein n=1 Tax=Acetanaerobacterium elongatum TaxID=258515 RepID=A0A1H0G786_9FIRM|nr:hypothetical protein [Acetanaerobacterium elongatum]SDO02721.1 hypothetical protein SAMN05192585_14810 [Acetanaerobacterium elongatum]